MKNIIKNKVPDYWLKLIKKNQGIKYKDLEKDCTEKRSLKADMLKSEQFYICCYCCKRVDENRSHIEHFKPKDLFPQKSMDYTNMLVSCTGNTCGMKKRTTILPESLSYSDWENRFTYTEDGLIKAKDNDADEAINILNLNDWALIQSRRETYDECLRNAKFMGKSYIKEYYIDNQNGELPRFPAMVEYFYNLGHFDDDVVTLI